MDNIKDLNKKPAEFITPMPNVALANTNVPNEGMTPNQFIQTFSEQMDRLPYPENLVIISRSQFGMLRDVHNIATCKETARYAWGDPPAPRLVYKGDHCVCNFMLLV